MSAAVLGFVETPQRRFTVLSNDDLAGQKPIQWRVKSVFPQTGIAAIYGPPGCGKSFMAMDLVQSIARGDSWFGYRTMPCNVLYICLEGVAGLAGRLAAYRLRHDETSGRVSYLVDSLNLLDSTDVDELIEAIQESDRTPKMIVIDTLAQSAPGFDENSGQDMSQVIAAAKRLQAATGGLCLLIHHSGKDSSKGLRGHSSLLAAMDAVIEIDRNGDARTWKIAKSKDSADSGKHAFGLETVQLAIDDDGDPVTSCVITKIETPGDQLSKLPPQGSQRRHVWDLLQTIFSEQDPFQPIDDIPECVPATKACIRLVEAIDAVAPKLPVDPKRQKERAKGAIEGLVNKGLLVFSEGFIWPK